MDASFLRILDTANGDECQNYNHGIHLSCSINSMISLLDSGNSSPQQYHPQHAQPTL